jgi:hypothetical protein
VKVARPATARADGERAREMRLCGRRKRCHLFVADVHPVDVAMRPQRFSDAVQAIADNSIDAADAEELRALLESQNLAAIDKFGVLAPSLSEMVGAVRFDRLRDAIDNLDFQLGAELLRQAVLLKSAASGGA